MAKVAVATVLQVADVAREAAALAMEVASVDSVAEVERVPADTVLGAVVVKAAKAARCLAESKRVQQQAWTSGLPGRGLPVEPSSDPEAAPRAPLLIPAAHFRG